MSFKSIISVAIAASFFFLKLFLEPTIKISSNFNPDCNIIFSSVLKELIVCDSYPTCAIIIGLFLFSFIVKEPSSEVTVPLYVSLSITLAPFIGL